MLVLEQYIQSVQPLLNDEEFEKMKKLAYEFQVGGLYRDNFVEILICW